VTNETPLKLVPAKPSDWGDVQALLVQRGLPVAGTESHLAEFVVGRDGGAVLAGVAGLEVQLQDACPASVTATRLRVAQKGRVK
jgi:hypothetical protein